MLAEEETDIKVPDLLPTSDGSGRSPVCRSSKDSCVQRDPSVCSIKKTKEVITCCSKYLCIQEQVAENGEEHDPKKTKDRGTDTLIELRCNPGGSVLLSLTKLSRCLAQLTVSAVRRATERQSGPQLAYPILQYLDAYIAQFGNFLAHQPLLMGAFLALKLTDPHFVDDANCVNALDGPKHVGLFQDLKGRKERLRKLHNHFFQIFSEAADTVAFSASRQLVNQMADRNRESLNETEIQAQEMAAANSRRAMLQDFLTWSRQFDAAWHEFQCDTWHQAVASNHQSGCENELFHISHGLNALFNHLQFNSSLESIHKTEAEDATYGLLQLLLDAKAELCFGLQPTR